MTNETGLLWNGIGKTFSVYCFLVEGARVAATVRDVARAAKVSVATVSKVLNQREGEIRISEATRRRVLEAARKLNYHPNVSARRLIAQESRTIGLVIEHYAAFGATVNAQILQGIGECLDEAEYSIELTSHHRIPDLYGHLKAMVAGKQVDALILWTETVDDDFCDYLRQAGVPHCHAAHYPASQSCPAILCDNFAGSYDATKHLLEQGHTRILIVVPEESPEGKHRLRGYRQALEDHGVAFDPEAVIHGNYTGEIDRSALDVERLRRLLPGYTAVFATSDLLAVAVKSVMRESGHRVGKDRALVGFDGLSIVEHLDPPLSSVHQDGYTIGRQAARSILSQLKGEEPGGWQFVPARLVVRASSRCRPLESSS